MPEIMISLFISGLLLGIGPCLATCGPLLISYIAGTRKNVIKSIGAYFLFSLSRISVYIILGLSVFFFGQLISKYIFDSFSYYIFIFGGVFIIIIGLFVAFGKNLNDRFCSRLQGFFLKKDAKTIILFGLIIGILPCLPLLSLLSYIGLVSKTWLDSFLYSLSFGLGTIFSPLFLLVIFTGLIPKIIMEKKVVYARVFNFVCGLVIIFLGIQLIRRAL